MDWEMDPVDDAIIEDTIIVECLICEGWLRRCMVDDEEVMWLPVHSGCLWTAEAEVFQEKVIEWAERISFFDR